MKIDYPIAEIKTVALLMVNVYKKCIVYKADVITNKDSHIYCGARDGEFKSPHNNYINSFHHRHQVQDIELSKYIWKI